MSRIVPDADCMNSHPETGIGLLDCRNMRIHQAKSSGCPFEKPNGSHLLQGDIRATRLRLTEVRLNRQRVRQDMKWQNQCAANVVPWFQGELGWERRAVPVGVLLDCSPGAWPCCLPLAVLFLCACQHPVQQAGSESQLLVFFITFCFLWFVLVLICCFSTLLPSSLEMFTVHLQNWVRQMFGIDLRLGQRCGLGCKPCMEAVGPHALLVRDAVRSWADRRSHLLLLITSMGHSVEVQVWKVWVVVLYLSPLRLK